MELNEPKQSWGGPWTEKKLDAFTKYVRSYLKIMSKNQYWLTIYFDGFAGSGKRNTNSQELIAQLSILPEEEKVYSGSAERVLKINDVAPFDFYYFIEKNEKAISELKSYLNTFEETKDKILEFRSGDCNTQLERLSKALKSKNPSYAALIFLDPFGMQIDWKSIEALRGTRSDIWILIPTGVIVNRLLDKKGELKSLKKLESFFGLNENEIKQHFYTFKHTQTLFGESEEVLKVMKPIEKISELYVNRLKTIWKYVTPKPMRLENSKGVPIFHLVFASNNASALKIAKQIINKN